MWNRPALLVICRIFILLADSEIVGVRRRFLPKPYCFPLGMRNKNKEYLSIIIWKFTQIGMDFEWLAVFWTIVLIKHQHLKSTHRLCIIRIFIHLFRYDICHSLTALTHGRYHILIDKNYIQIHPWYNLYIYTITNVHTLTVYYYISILIYISLYVLFHRRI